jgi:hypothetical protein
MANGNSVTIIGSLTRDPELRYTQTATTSASRVTSGRARRSLIDLLVSSRPAPSRRAGGRG